MNAFGQAMKTYQEQNQMRGAQFIPAYVSSEGFGIFKDLVVDFSTFPFTFISGEGAFFSINSLGPNEFYRLNPDSTVSVHRSSNTASADYVNFGTGVEYTGNRCSMGANYTGPVSSFEVPFPPYIFYFINMGETNAFSFRGAGTVRLNGTDAAKTLTARTIGTTSGHSSVDFDLH